MEITRFIVVCPKGVATGGPEALHQLSLSLRESGAESLMWDPDPNRRHSTVVAHYEIYGNEWLETEPSSGDVLVIPEVLSELIPKFYDSNLCIFWWLSVDNFFESKPLPIDVIRDNFPKVIHAYQSEYARIFLDQIEISNSLSISDYLNPKFLKQFDKFSNNFIKENTGGLLAINPAKGIDRTLQLLERLPEERVIRLEKMSASEVLKALRSATYYLDLGHHPGKDRFPREAATQGCIVLTNKRGSAANNIDIPIDPDEFKFDDSDPDFVGTIYSKLLEIDLDLELYSKKQSTYRDNINGQKDCFDNEVSKLLIHVGSIVHSSSKDELPKENKLASYLSSLFMNRDALAQERDALAQERDALAQERDALAQERDIDRKRVLEIEKSLSWKFTAPLRRLDGLLRKRP